MLRIAICDDDRLHSSTLHTLLLTYCEQHSIAAQIMIFHSGFDLLSTVDDQGPFDLYFLDILMPGMTGIDVGHKIRQEDTSSLIIYLTSSAEYAVESYMIRAFHYLIKPFDLQLLTSVLNQAFDALLPKKDQFILVKTQESIVKLPLDQILYAELYNQSVRYCLLDGSFLNTLSLHESFLSTTAPLTKYTHFVRCGASFVVNLKQVSSIQKNVA